MRVDDDGTVRITADCSVKAQRAMEIVSDMLREVEIGHTFEAPVVSIIQSGCFVRVAEVKDGLVHISELADARISRVKDVVKVGDVIWELRWESSNLVAAHEVVSCACAIME